MRLPNGIETDDRPIIAFDWSRDEVISSDGKRYTSFIDAAPHYVGHILVFESTAESFELQKRQLVLDAFEANNIEAFCSNTKYTSQYRMKFDIAKSDEADAKLLYHVFTETILSWSRFKEITEEDSIRDEIKTFLIEDRYLYEKKNTSKLIKKYIPKEILPQFKDFILSGKAYRKPVGSILKVAETVRAEDAGYREFRRQLGNYGQGYASMPRSEFYWWWVRVVLNKRLKEQHIEKKYKEIPDSKTGKTKKLRIWSDAELRLRKQALKDAVKAAQYLWHLTDKF